MPSPCSLVRAALVALLILGTTAVVSDAQPPRSSRSSATQAQQEGNYREAYESFRKMAFAPDADERVVAIELPNALQALRRLDRLAEADRLLEDLAALHAARWQMQWIVARGYIQLPHFGYIIAGRFERGPHRGGGETVQSIARDRVRALQLMSRALADARRDDRHAEVAKFYLDLANMLLLGRTGNQAWRLQELTDLTKLPDYEQGWGGDRATAGAPVDDRGQPVFYRVPASFQAATNDGQRWRCCLAEAVEFDAAVADKVRLQWADFLHSQFGTQTLGGYFQPREEQADQEPTGTYALHTLGEDETIARLAVGIRRFKLPEEFNPLRLYRQIAEQGHGDYPLQAWTRLANLFENRRQYPQAAQCWRQCIQRSREEQFRRRLEQIEGAWGRFEPTVTQPAGQGATVDYRFRNGRSVEFTAQEINVQKLIENLKAYLKSQPRQLDWRKLQIGDLGYQLVEGDRQRYVGRQVAAWTLALEPRPNHFDRRITVTTPLEQAGAYLLTAKMAGGNTQYAIVWLDDTALVKKQLDGKTLYFTADARDGRPVPHAELEFFGWQHKYTAPNRPEVFVRQFAERSDAQGQVFVTLSEQDSDYQWLVIARSGQRFAQLGFTRMWTERREEQTYRETKVYTITDRPVYRPGQTVHFKFWIGQADYDQPDVSAAAGKMFAVEITNPKDEKVLARRFTADTYGGIEGRLDLPADAALGEYQLVVVDQGGGSFRVEEYKKPEFEVEIKAPEAPVALGEKVQATVQAKYYFGSPVTKARVKVKVERRPHEDRWYPLAPWDWLYGPGYWWFGYDYDWLPGWSQWGWRRPIEFMWRVPFGHQPPELISEHETQLGPDGTVKVEIDTALAKALHPNQDHQYTITAEVTDQSRRTIVGTGQVLAARRPFAVAVWTERGYHRVGDTITVGLAARSPDGKPVAVSGTLELLRIRYADGKSSETPVQSWPIAVDTEQRTRHQITASQPGQYRLSAKLRDAAGHTIEGGAVLTILGEGFDAAQFRFQHIELVPDQREYQPGQKVRLLINTDRPDATVLLFVRPAGGVYPRPQILRLQGKSTVREIAVVQGDMPNFFVEAVTVADGRLYSQVKQIVVPPEKRVLNVAVQMSATTYRPGQKAEVQLRVTDFHGQPFVGSLVVAMYDKAVEYIAGGSNVANIREFFWQWCHHHRARGETNLGHMFRPFQSPRQPGMSNLGLFGYSVADEMDQEVGGIRNRMLLKSAARGEMAADSAPAPAAAAPMMLGKGGAGLDGKGGQPAAPALVQPTVRTKFADTALWVGSLTTGADGTVRVPLDMPENLTTWRVKSWAMGPGTRVGEGACDVVTRKDLIVRLQAPRFFVEKDEVVLSANVHNYLKSEKLVRVVLELAGGQLAGPADMQREVRVAANGEARVDWRVRVVGEGQTVVRMKALSDEESDATEQTFPCYVHGMLKTESWSGAIRPDGKSGRFTIVVPAERRAEQTRLEVRWSPTLAGALVDALPYLADYPYGCTEQTLSRFLPTVITAGVLQRLGLDLEAIGKQRSNLDAQAVGDDRQRSEGWRRRERNPVFSSAELQRMVKEGLARLTEMQLSDGGWGWFSGWGEHSMPHTTAYVVHGLQVARQCDLALVPEVLDRGVAWLKRYQQEQLERIRRGATRPKDQPWKQAADNLDALVYMVLVDAGADSPEMREFLYRDRTGLAVYSLVMFGLAVEKVGDREKLEMLLRNLSQYVAQDEENQTAWLRLPADNYWWCWYGSEIEAQAYYLKLLARTDPHGQLASRLAKYLLNNRKHATYWNSTRDTAVAIEALADYLRASGEQRPEMTVEVRLDGRLLKTVEITPTNLFRFDNRLVIEGAALGAGRHEIELRRTGQGPLYYNGHLTNFTQEDPITRAGLEIKVQRRYYRLEREQATATVAGGHGQAIRQEVEKYRRVPLADLATVGSGQLVEIELEIASKNDYEYLIFEDMKPAGFEPVELRSGYTDNALGAYVEFRDNRVVFFVSRLARGQHSVSYRMRAEVPGRFSALPTRASAMYAPELKANSDELRLRVEDAGEK